MSDTLITIIAIFLAAVLMFIFPLMSVSERNDDIAQTVVQTATSEFTSKISTQGVITVADYENFMNRLAATGNTYDVEIEVQKLDESYGKKSSIVESSSIGENARYSIFTGDVLNNVYGGSDGYGYGLNKGDNVIVTVKNTNRTIAQILRTFLYRITGKGNYTIAASSSSMVINTNLKPDT